MFSTVFGLRSYSAEHQLTEHSIEFRDFLELYTVGRSNFRVHPDTPTDDGVEAGLTEDQLIEDLNRLRKKS